MKSTKKWLVGLMILFLMIGAVRLPVFAAETEEGLAVVAEGSEQEQMIPSEEKTELQDQNDSVSIGIKVETPADLRKCQVARPSRPAKRSNLPDLTEYKAYFVQQAMSCPDYIDISKFQFAHTSEMLKYIIEEIYYETPEAFVYGISDYDYNNGIITGLTVKYRDFADTASEYANAHAAMLSGANTLLKGIEGNTQLTDVDKILLLHDRLALWTAYHKTSPEPNSVYTAYGALGQQSAVCMGYADAYMYLLERVGIKSDYCSSDVLDHGWNIVYLNDKKYHVDVTWDDPTWDRFGRVYHDNLLVSDTGIYNTGHHDNGIVDYTTDASDTTYDSYYWQKSKTAFVWLDGKFYYINSEDENLYEQKDGIDKVLFSVKESGYGGYRMVKLALANRVLLYSTATAIKSYDLNTGLTDTVWTPSLTGNNKIYGFKYENGTIFCHIYDSVSSSGAATQISYAYEPPCTSHQFTLQSESKPTCTATGGKISKCDYCSQTKTEPIAALGHSYTVYVKSITPTCTTDGSTIYKCSRCTATKTVKNTGAKGHTWKRDDSLSSTGVADGYAYYICTACKNTKKDYDAELAQITGQPADVTADSGTTVQFRVETPGIVASYKWEYRKIYKWFDTTLTGYKTDTLTVPVTGTRNGYDYRCVVTFANGTVVVSEPAELTVNTFITIETQPYDQTIVPGGNGRFTAKATGESVKYQWQYQRPDSEKWIDTTMEGAKKETLVVQATNSRNGYKYRCKITDVAGKEVFSDVATFSVLKISSHPVSVTANENQEVSFTVGVGAKRGYTCQWQYSKNQTTWSNITSMEGYQTGNLKVVATMARNGYWFRCVITDSRNNKLYSDYAVLTVNQTAAITSDPESATAVVGGIAKFTVGTSGNAAYQWQFSSDGKTWKNTDLSGCNSDTLLVPVITGRNGYQYRCVVTGNDGVEKISKAATLKVARITGQPKNGYGFVGSTVNYSVVLSNTTNLNYVWQYRKNEASNWMNTTMEGYSTMTLKAGVTAARNGYQYRCVITDRFGYTLESESAVMHVLSITQKPVDRLTLLDGKAIFTVTVSEPAAVTYQWQYRKSETDDWINTDLTGCKTEILTADALESCDGYQYRCVITDSAGTQVCTESAALRILTITKQPTAAIAGEGKTAEFTVATNISEGFTYRWQYLRSETSGWTNTTMEGYNTAKLKVVATEGRNNYRYRCVIVDESGNEVSSEEATLKVLRITGQPESVTVEVGQTASFFVSTNIPMGYTYQWQYSKDGTNWHESNLDDSFLANLTVTATLARNGYQYRCVLYVNGVEAVISQVATLTVTVPVEPAKPAQITSQPADAKALSTGDAKFSVKADNAASYLWQYRRTETGKWSATSMTGYDTDTLTVSDIEKKQGYQYRCVVTGEDGVKVYSEVATLGVIEFTKHPENAFGAIGGTVGFAVELSDETGIKYQWQYLRKGATNWTNTNMEGYNTNMLQVEVTDKRDGYQYRCVAVDAFGNEGISETAVLSLLSVTGQPADITVEAGQVAAFTVTLNLTEGITYQWLYSKDGNKWYETGLEGYNTASLQVPATVARNGYQYHCAISVNGVQVLTSNAAVLTVTEPEPVEPADPAKITSQPKEAKAFLNGNAKFKVKATGAVSYQWQYRRTETGKWTATTMTGYDTATLTVGVTAARQGYQYRCVVTGEDGVQVCSDAAVLTVIVVTKQPAMGYGFIGGNTRFSVEVSDATGIKYEWQYRRSETAAWTGTTMTGYNKMTLVVAVTAARNGYQYRCKLTDSFGNVLETESACLCVVKITGHPVDQSCTSGDVVDFVVTTDNPAVVSYQWQYRRSETGAWTNTTMDGYDTDLLCVEATAKRNGYQYRCILRLPNGSTLESNFATLTVK